MKKTISKIIAICIILVFAAFPNAYAQTADESAGTTASAFGTTLKDETVYVNLKGDGQVGEINIVNRLSGASAYTDYGDYGAVTNLTDSSAISGQNGAYALTPENASQPFYYQGTCKNLSIPWKIGIAYSLNGKSIPPEELAGKSGSLEIRIKISPDKSAQEYFKKMFALQLTLPFYTDRCTFTNMGGAQSAVIGEKTQLTFTLLPGKTAEYSIRANVTGFKMDAISIAAAKADLDYSQYVDTSEITGQFDDLKDGLSDMIDGTGELKDGLSDLSGGVSKLASGSADLKSGMKKYQTGMSSYEKGLKSFITGTEQVSGASDKIGGALKDLSANGASLLSGYQQLGQGLQKMSLSKQDQAALTAMAALKDSPDPEQATIGRLAGQILSMAGGMDQVSSSLSKLNGGLKDYTEGVSALSSQYGGFNAGLSNLAGNASKLGSGFSNLKSGYGDVYSGFSDINGALSKLKSKVKPIPEKLDPMTDGLKEMKDGIQTEQDKLDDYLNPSEDVPIVSFAAPGKITPASVQFVMQTPAITEKTDKAEIHEEEDTTNLFDKIINLFK